MIAMPLTVTICIGIYVKNYYIAPEISYQISFIQSIYELFVITSSIYITLFCIDNFHAMGL